MSPDPQATPGQSASVTLFEIGTISMISRYEAEIIARATALLEDDEARAAEAAVLARSTRGWPATWPPPLRPALRPPGA
jgi:hypothetical protein